MVNRPSWGPSLFANSAALDLPERDVERVRIADEGVLAIHKRDVQDVERGDRAVAVEKDRLVACPDEGGFDCVGGPSRSRDALVAELAAGLAPEALGDDCRLVGGEGVLAGRAG